MYMHARSKSVTIKRRAFCICSTRIEVSRPLRFCSRRRRCRGYVALWERRRLELTVEAMIQGEEWQSGRRSTVVSVRKLADDVAHKGLCIAKEHQSLIPVVERVIDSSEAWAHAALNHHDGLSLVHVNDGHAVDGAGLVAARGGIRNVGGADDKGDVRLREVGVHVIHIEKAIVRDVGLGKEDVHVAGHATGDGMDAEFHVD